MIKLTKRFFFVLFFLTLILISSCTSGKNTKKSIEEIRIGSEGIVVSFLPNAPPEKIHVEQGEKNEFEVVLELKNKGAYPQPDEGTSGLGPEFGKIYLSGFDRKIIELSSKDGESGDLSTKTLEGKSTINPNGGQDILSFTGKIDFNNLNVEKYEPTLLATACYYYNTIAGPSVCIDPNPYSTIKEKKVCEVQDITLTNQGAPVAVTRVDEEAFATKTRFKITVKNVGSGEVMKADAANSKCDPSGTDKIVREDIDKVNLMSVKIADKELTCQPFVDGPVTGTKGLIRLANNGEGFVVCELPSSDYNNKVSAYTTPLKIQLSYGYRNTAEKKIQIKKESPGLSGGSENTPSSSSDQSRSSSSAEPSSIGNYDNPQLTKPEQEISITNP